MSAGFSPETGPLTSGSVPPLADCFTPRPQSGPGPLDAQPAHRRLVLTSPRPAGQSTDNWPGVTGKTQLAVHLVRAWQQENPSRRLLWLTAASRDSVLSGYAQAAGEWTETGGANDAEAVAARFLSWLADSDQPWLAVLDGVTDPGDLDGLWPDGPSGRVLVTGAADTTVPVIDGDLAWPIGAFSPQEALTHLKARLNADPDQRLGAVDLVDDLDCDPIAVAQAGAVVASSGMTCREYRDIFLRRRDEIAKASGAQPVARAVTWLLSAGYADETVPGGLVEPCLALAALFGIQGIPERLFETRAAAEFITGAAGDTIASAREHAALLSLRDTSLLAIGPDGMLWMTQAVQSAVMAAMPNATLEQAAVVAADALLEAWPAGDEPASLGRALRACAASLDGAASDELWAAGKQEVLFRAGLSLDAARLTRSAVRHWRAVADVSQRVLGAAHPDTLAAAGRLAGASLDAGLGEDAVELRRQILDISVRMLGPGHPHTIAAQADLASALLAAGQPGEAVAMLESALAGGAHTVGTGTVDTGAIQASAFQAATAHAGTAHAGTVHAGTAPTGTGAVRTGPAGTGKAATGEAGTGDGSAEAGTAESGTGVVDTVALADSLAAAYQEAGRHKDAIRTAERVLAERERRQGPDQLETLRARRRLASACLAAGRTKDAIGHGRRALAGAERVLAPGHPDITDSVVGLASAYHSAHKLKDAIPLYERAVSELERAVGPDDPGLIAIRGNLASAYHSAGRLASALELYERTRADCQQILGPDHPDTLAARANLAHAYYAMGRNADSERLLRSTLADCERLLEPGDPLTEAVRDSLNAVSRG